MANKIWIIFGSVMTILAAIGMLTWYLGYADCRSKIDIADVNGQMNCAVWLIENHPDIVEAKDITEQCNSSDANCVKAIATKVVSDKAQDDANKAVS